MCCLHEGQPAVLSISTAVFNVFSHVTARNERQGGGAKDGVNVFEQTRVCEQQEDKIPLFRILMATLMWFFQRPR